MKMTNEWHQECLKNSKISLSEKLKELARMEANVKKMIGEVEFYEYQINSSLNQKEDGFDREKFLKK